MAFYYRMINSFKTSIIGRIVYTLILYIHSEFVESLYRTVGPNQRKHTTRIERLLLFNLKSVKKQTAGICLQYSIHLNLISTQHMVHKDKVNQRPKFKIRLLIIFRQATSLKFKNICKIY